MVRVTLKRATAALAPYHSYIAPHRSSDERRPPRSGTMGRHLRAPGALRIFEPGMAMPQVAADLNSSNTKHLNTGCAEATFAANLEKARGGSGPDS
jgi:hypothetical protein